MIVGIARAVDGVVDVEPRLSHEVDDVTPRLEFLTPWGLHPTGPPPRLIGWTQAVERRGPPLEAVVVSDGDLTVLSHRSTTVEGVGGGRAIADRSGHGCYERADDSNDAGPR